MFHLGAFAESIDPAGALVPITAVQDQVVTTQGDDMRVPVGLPYMVGEAAVIDGTADIQCLVTSPSLRRVANINVAPYNTGTNFNELEKLRIHPMNPIPLVGDESVNFLIESNPAAAALQYGLVWFSDGALQPVSGEVYTVRCTMSVTAVNASWVNGNLEFPEDLPIGNYDVVGMRCFLPTGIAARLVFVGGTYRPGVAAASTVVMGDCRVLRDGKMGVFGSFHTNTPPTVDILAAAGAVTPEIYLDIIPRG